MKKNIQLVCQDVDLYKKFNSSELFDTVAFYESINISPEYDYYLVSDRLISLNKISELIEEKDEAKRLDPKKVVYLLSDNFSNYKPVLEAKGVFTIPPQLTITQIFEKFCEYINIDLNVKLNVIAFFGADSKVGTTTTALAIAEDIAKNTNCKVCYLNLSGYPSYEYIKSFSISSGLDSIKPKIFNEILSADELMSSVIKNDNLYILLSSKNLLNLRFYYPEHVDFLISLASTTFDIVIVDAGYNPITSGLYVGVLNSVKNKFLVTTQLPSSKALFEYIKEQIYKELDVDMSKFLLIVNKYIDSPDYPTAAKVAEDYDISLASYIPYCEYSWQAEFERSTLMGFDAEYDSKIQLLSNIICKQVGIEYKNTQSKNIKKHFLFRRKKVK